MKRRQSGYILIAMVVMLAAISSVALVRGLKASTRSDAREQRLAMRAMREAKMALIGKAMTESNTAGSFTCPDVDNNGSADTVGSCVDTGNELLGCVPWMTLGVSSADRLGIEPLRYALSPAFNNFSLQSNERNVPARQINLDNLGTLSLSPNYPKVIAMLIAPGPALDGQVHNFANPCATANAANYLEAVNATANGNFVALPHDDNFNDTIMPITGSDLYAPLANIVLSQFVETSITPTRGLRWYFMQGNAPASLQHIVIPSPASPKVSIIMDRDANSVQFDQQFELTPPLPAPPPAGPAGPFLSPGVNNGSCNLTQTIDASGAPTTTGKKASSWLCYNRWYDYISYRVPNSNSVELTVSLASPSTRSCKLSIDTTNTGVPDKLTCN